MFHRQYTGERLNDWAIPRGLSEPMIMLQDSSEPAAEPAAFVALAAVAAQGAQGEVTLTLLPAVIRHLNESGWETELKPHLCLSPPRVMRTLGDSAGKTHPLKF